MPQITYIEPSGESKTLQLQEGWSLLQGASLNAIEGMVGECGGACGCGTCHCYVEESRLHELPAPEEKELEMLGFVAAERRPNSRLACQIKATAKMDGLVVRMPEMQE